MVPVPEAMEPTLGWLASFRAALEPFEAGNYLNFRDDKTELDTAFPAATVARLREVKQRYDAENLFHANHPVTG